jgi:hypothetical protein
MSTISREYKNFKKNFIGPKLKRKQRIALMPLMPAKKPVYTSRSRYKSIPLSELSPEDKKKAL